MAANVESMFSVREVPWHGIGTVVQDAPTAADAIRLAGLDWLVQPRPLYCNNEQVRNKVGIIRRRLNPETDKYEENLLGVVSDKYQIIQNFEAFDFFDSLAGSEARYETAGSLAEGKRTFLTAQMERQWSVADDSINTYLVMSNGFDGYHSLRVAVTPVRVVCQNTLTAAFRNARRCWNLRHYTKLSANLREAQRALQLTGHYMEAFCEFGNRAADQRVSENKVEQLIETLFPANKTDSDRAKESRLKRIQFFEQCLGKPDVIPYMGTVWGLLNAVSDYETHRRQKPEALMKRVLNDRLPLFQTAFEILTA